MKARIAEIENLAPSLRRLSLTPAQDTEFPAASAGANIVLRIPGPERVWKNAYSLVNPPGARNSYQIIVRRVAASRGGSAWLHDHAAVGQAIEIGMPANFFPIAGVAQSHLLFAAGIGITPFLSYLPALRKSGARHELHHFCRADEAEAFRALLPDSAHLHTSRQTRDFGKLLAAQNLRTHLYICGPESFMDAIAGQALLLGWPPAKMHLERFGAAGGAAFTVRLARSGVTLAVGHDESLLEALENAGFDPPNLCRGGACGVCELPVLAGRPEHHDHFLPPGKRAAGTAIMTCVSRAKTPELVLDF